MKKITIKQKDINHQNFTEYIKERIEAGDKYIKWTNPKALQVFWDIAQCVASSDGPGSLGIGWELPDNFPHKHNFMGIKHYICIKRTY